MHFTSGRDQDDVQGGRERAAQEQRHDRGRRRGPHHARHAGGQFHQKKFAFSFCQVWRR